MKVLDQISVVRALAEAMGKPCLYVSGLHGPEDGKGFADPVEAQKAAPYLNLCEHGQVFADGCAVIVCENEDEMNRLYRQTVGDDGPSRHNRYAGPARVYALTCSADGRLMNENT